MYKLWFQIRSSLWFVPTLLVLAGIGLGIGLVQVDVWYGSDWKIDDRNPFFGVGAAGSRAMLAAIASSMITVAGVAFSITIVTLALGSSQYTPRILRNFMRDRWNQFVLGMFVGIFVYCLIVMRTIRAGGEDEFSFVPVLAVFVAVLLALSSIACLIFFIHHTAASIQASTILARINDETKESIRHSLPEEAGAHEEIADAAAPVPRNGNWTPIAAAGTGYVQRVDHKALLRSATEEGLIVRVDRIGGDFATAGAPVLSADREIDDKLAARLRELVTIGEFRVPNQDPGFGVRQIVDIGLKALSPGVNDTSTAVSCLDYLGSILSFLATRRGVSAYRTDEKGAVRLIAPAADFGDLVAKSMDEIRLVADGNVTILLQMLCVLCRVGESTQRPDRKRPLVVHARLIAEAADRSVSSAHDRARINERLATMRASLDAEEHELPLISERASAAPAAG